MVTLLSWFPGGNQLPMVLARRKNKSPQLPECPLDHCIKLISGAWALNIIWALSGGARRFSELRSDIDGISAKVLSARVHELEERGVVARKVVPTKPPTVEYSLTDLGQELMPVIDAIAGVSSKLRRRRGSPFFSGRRARAASV